MSRAKWIVTEKDPQTGIETGYVTLDGEPQFDFDRDPHTGEYRTCGYGDGCFWTDWRGQDIPPGH